MDPTGLSHLMFLEKLHRLEQAGRGQNKTIITKLILKLGGGNQDFGRQNISMSQPPFDSTIFGKNTINGTVSPIDSILLVVLKNPLVVPVAWGLVFPSQQESSQLVTLLR